MKRLHLILGAGLLVAGLMYLPLRADDKTPTAIAQIKGVGANKDKIKGTVEFHQTSTGVHISANIDGLTPGKHGFHIHESPIKGDDLASAASHWNPQKKDHGGPDSPSHHAGDLGNITADDKGHATLSIEIPGITVDGKESVVGHSVIVHEKEDDLKDIKSAGNRIAGGNIELKK